MARFPLDSWFANGGAVRFWHFRNKLKTIHIPLRTDRDTNMGTRWKRDEIDARKCQLLHGPPHECSVIMQKTPWFWLQPDDSDVILFTALRFLLLLLCCCSVVARGAYCSCYAIVYPNGMDTYLKERKSGALWKARVSPIFQLLGIFFVFNVSTKATYGSYIFSEIK